MPKALFHRILPLFIFLMIWGISITLYNTLSLNLYDIRPATWLIIGISLVTVTIGYLSVFFLYDNVQFSESNRSGSAIPIEILYRSLVAISIVCFIGTFLYLYLLSSSVGSIYDFLSNPVKARYLVTKIERESITNWDPRFAASNYLVSLNLIGVIFGGYYYVFGKKHRLVAALPLLNSVVFSVVTFQRYFFVQIVISWLFCIIYSMFYQKKEIREKQAIKTFLIISGSALGIFLFVLGIVLARIDYGTGDVDMIQTTGWALKSLSKYIVAEMVALDKYLFGPDTLLYGLSIFRSFIKWLIRFGIYDTSAGLSVYYEFTKVGPGEVNTYTYIRPFYEDYGIYGLLFFSFMFGVGGSLSIHSMLTRFSFVKLYLASLMFFAYFLSFFNSTFLNLTMFIFLFFVLYALEKFMLNIVIKTKTD